MLRVRRKVLQQLLPGPRKAEACFSPSAFPSSQRRGGAEREPARQRKRDSAQPQEKHEASIEVRQNRGNAGLTTPSAPLRWLRDILLMAQPFLRLRPIGLALRALLCEEGNITRPVRPSNLRISFLPLTGAGFTQHNSSALGTKIPKKMGRSNV